MRILLSSYVFYPSIGGIESFSMLLAEQLIEQGHQVTVITETPHDKEENYPFRIIRQATAWQKFKAVKECDVFFHSNLTLSNIWPLLFLRRPWLVTHQTWIANTDGRIRPRDHLKRLIIAAAQSISISKAIANSIDLPSVIIPNSYEDSVFASQANQSLRKGIAFVGRLVSDKGVDLLIEACGRLKAKKVPLDRISIIGIGPESDLLEEQAQACGLSEIIRFPGKITGQALAAELNQHRVMVVPSRWNEPFGIVALEGIACGCLVIGSSGGGLIDAIGPCGPTFNNNNLDQLEKALQSVLINKEVFQSHLNAIPKHIEKFKPNYIFKKYLDLFATRFEGKTLVTDSHPH